MSSDVQDLIFDTLPSPVRLCDCAELIEQLGLLFPGWPIEPATAPRADPVLRVERDGDGFRFEGDWLRQPLCRLDLTNAASALVAEVVRAWIHADDGLLCLHGAGAEFTGRLVVFPSQYRAGKSLLSAGLAAAGIPLYADDVLPIRIDDGRAMAPGLAPRLRLPLPDTVDPATREFIEQNRALAGERYLYLDLAGSGLVARGELAPIGSFVLLDRKAGAATALEPISSAEVLRQVVWQNFSREGEAPRILETLNRLVAGARRFRLHYDRPGDAVALLVHEFGRWPEQVERGAAVPLPPPGDAGGRPLATGQYRRRADIRMLDVDDECFLADAAGAAIHHLNPVGAAIWTLLANPVEMGELIAVLADAFPGVERHRIERDVVELITILEQKNLVESGGDGG